MHRTKSYSNYRWWIRKPYQTGASALQGISQDLAASFPDRFPPDHVAELERLLLWQTSQMIESDGGLPEGGATSKNLLRLPKGCPWGQEGRLYRVAPRPQSSHYQ